MAKYDYYTKNKTSSIIKIINQSYRSRLWNTIKQKLPPEAKICEIGPGRGELASLITNTHSNYTGIEESEHASFLLKDKFSIIHSSAPPLPLEDSSHDVCVLSHVLEHFPSVDSISSLYNEIHRILKPNGIILIATPNILDMKASFYDCDWTHQFPTSPYRLRRIAEDHNFTVIKERYIYLGIPGYFGRILRAPLYLLFTTIKFIMPDRIRYSNIQMKIETALIQSYCQVARKN
ncbi:MAG: class I SAM-dependent methyltransferase [Fibrobacterales bacterium]